MWCVCVLSVLCMLHYGVLCCGRAWVWVWVRVRVRVRVLGQVQERIQPHRFLQMYSGRPVQSRSTHMH